MRTLLKELVQQTILIVLVWTAGLALGIFVLALQRFCKLKVQNRKGLFRQGPTLVVANHPSMWETIVLVGLFFPKYLFAPHRTPWSTPDKRNVYDRWYVAWLRPHLIAIPRDDARELPSALKKIIKALCRGETVILFAEGGRTHKGERHLRSKTGKRIRLLKRAALKRIFLGVPNLNIVPVWVTTPDDTRLNISGLPGQWHPMHLLIGEPLLFQEGMSIEERISQLEQTLLELADQVDHMTD